MVLRVIGGVVVGGFATYGVVKFVEALDGKDALYGERGTDGPEISGDDSEPVETAIRGQPSVEETQEAVSPTVPLM